MPEPDYLDFSYDMFLSSIDGEAHEATRFSQWMDAVEDDDLYAFESVRQEAQYPVVHAKRTSGMPLEMLNLSSYNYLGLGFHPEVKRAAQDAIEQFGLGACSSPCQAGTLLPHVQLERALVDFMGLPERGVSLFSSGYGVNLGVISALVKRRHHVVVDKSAHMSILEGAQLARGKVHYFEHNDVDDLRRVITGLGDRAKRVVVCTEGVFSSDGDKGHLGDLVPAAKELGAHVLVDEAHSFLVAGQTGRGVCEEQGVLDLVDYYVLTFSKALGGVGGALVAHRDIARYVNWYARCRMFSCALPPGVTAGVAKALEIGASEEGRARRERTRRNAEHLRTLLEPHVNIGPSTSWIIPVIYGSERRTLPLADWLQRNGLEASVMEFPAVPIGEARVRLFVTSEHTPEHMERAADLLIRAAREFGFHRGA